MKKINTLEEWEREIQDARGSGIKSFLRIGRALQAISEGNLWERASHDSFESYVECIHGFKRSWAYSLIGVWHVYGDLLLASPELQDVEITRLVKLLPLTTEENKEELAHSAACIPDVQGFENMIRNLKGKVATDDPHNCDFVSIDWEQCKICGKKRKPSIQ